MSAMSHRVIAVALAAIGLASAAIWAQGDIRAQGQSKPERMAGHTFRPEKREPTDELIRQLKVPAGFRVNVFASGLDNPRMLAVGPDGTVYVTRPDRDDVIALRDRGDGKAEENLTRVVSGLELAHGIVIHGNRIYVAGVQRVIAADVKGGGAVGDWTTLIDDLPVTRGHNKRTLGVGPDGMLYVSIGSSCNDCEERHREHATLLRARLDGSERTVFARGLRNTIGFAWHPVTRQLWGMDHGSDWRGDDQPPEELNRLVEGADYGWPYCFGDRKPDPFVKDPKGSTKAGRCTRTAGAVLGYQAHSAPIAMVFYTGTRFPREFHHDAFVAMRGSWNRRPATGYKVVRIEFENGMPRRFEDFLAGFLVEEGTAHFGRLAGLAVARDGALLVSDDTNGMIYRVSYEGSR